MTPRWARARLVWEVRRAVRSRPRPDEEVAALRRFALERSPYLRRTHDGADDAPLHQLPVLTKAELVEHFDELVTDRGLRRSDLERHVASTPPGTPFGRYRVGVSSGSSGRPGVFAFDRREWAAKIANATRARAVTGIRNPGARAAKIASPSAWHLSLQVGSTLSDPRRPTLRLPATTPVDQLVDELDRWRPTLLSGYASVLGALADAQIHGALRIGPTAVLSGGELLSERTRARIVEAWGVEPHDQYVTTEAGFVASECEQHDGMHLVDDLVVEIVDDEGQPVPHGGTGAAVLVTVPSSRTLPLLRYRIDDAVVVDTSACRCGRTSARIRVLGRGRELLEIPAASGRVTVHPVVFSQVLDAHRLTGWQVVHRGGRIELRLAGAGGAAAGIADEVGRALRRATGASVPVSVRDVDEIRRGSSGKAALVVDEDLDPGAAGG